MKFRTKTIVGVSLIELTLLAILVTSTLYLLEHSNKGEIQRRIQITSSLLHASTKDAIIAYDLATLSVIVNETIKTGELAYLRIIDRNGRVMAASTDAPPENANIRHDSSLGSVDDSIFDGRVIVEEYNHIFGEIHYGIALSNLDSVLKKARKQTIVIAMLEVIMVAIFSLLLGTYLTRSLIRIQRASQNLAHGKLDTRIQVTGNDELAETAKAFNFMANALQQRAKDRDAALRKAEEASEAKNRFLAGMSHELRTPLNSIIGFTHRILKNSPSDLDARHIDALQTIEKNGVHLLNLINTVLDLSKISAGKMEVFQESFELKSLLKEIINDVYDPTDQHYITLIAPSPDIHLNTDATKLKQIIINYISNARKYSPPGPIEILSKELNWRGKEAVEVAVIDSGKGVPEEDISALFTPFSQFDTFNNRKLEGTGLGLSLVAELAHKLNGQAYYSRTEDDRTAFSVIVPCTLSANTNSANLRPIQGS